MFRNLSRINILRPCSSTLIQLHLCRTYAVQPEIFRASWKWHGRFKTQSWILVQHACVSKGGASHIGVRFQRDWQLVTVGAPRAARGLHVTTARNTVAGIMRSVRLTAPAMPTAHTSYHSLRPKKRRANGSLIWPGMTGERREVALTPSENA